MIDNDWTHDDGASAMHEMDEEQLAAAAYVCRTRAILGDSTALIEAKLLEAELLKRIGPPPSMFGLLDPVPAAEPKPAQFRWPFW
jgi:hypothetical protein